MQGRSRDGCARLMVVGIVLCLLAAVFALEAKLALYNPNAPAQVQISANKLNADEAPKHASQAPAFLAAEDEVTSYIALLLVIAVAGVLAIRFVGEMAAPAIATDPGSFPPLFLRPPPRA